MSEYRKGQNISNRTDEKRGVLYARREKMDIEKQWKGHEKVRWAIEISGKEYRNGLWEDLLRVLWDDILYQQRYAIVVCARDM